MGHWLLAVVCHLHAFASGDDYDSNMLLQKAHVITGDQSGQTDVFDCDTDKDFMPGKKRKRRTIDLTEKNGSNPVYLSGTALDHCKAECTAKTNCMAFYFQKRPCGGEMCGFYSAVNPFEAVDHENQEGSQVCIRSIYTVGRYKKKRRKNNPPRCTRKASPVTSPASCNKSATLLGKTYRGLTHLPHYPHGCSDRIGHDVHGGVWWNTAPESPGSWKGFKGKVALVCYYSKHNPYSVGPYKTRPRDETKPICPSKKYPVTSAAICEKSATLLGKTFRGNTSLPLYPPGCSDRIDHIHHAGVWWNTDEGAEGDSWTDSRNSGFNGEVALVCS